jgi:DNA-binding IclR family transcriptional regulator
VISGEDPGVSEDGELDRDASWDPLDELPAVPGETSQGGIRSLEIGMQLVAAMAEHAFDEPPPMLKTLAAAAGMPPAKAHRYLVSLVRSGMVERDPVTGRYQLGPMARTVGLRALQSLDVVKIAGPRLPAYAAQLGFSVALAIWGSAGPTIIAAEDVRRPITIGTRVGEVMPMLSSATGQVFAAWLPRDVTREAIEDDLRRSPSSGRLSAAEVEALLDEVRTTGVGATVGGLNSTVNALSAPVVDHRGVLVAALSALGPADRFDAGRDGDLARRIAAVALDVSRDLGFVSPSREG